ncbi:acyl-CoA dehydrogenase [Kineobactrum sediminis]|uniref:Acyl-CoA dehydrogenase n=1 Tax=Kineobactrum sediminis TaxID=1905677 RepID=A0A2N5Y2V6_9GAMM|nr:acyl-CoA dehydrogenase family protein [Kineobactrum sediminis]PLW82718.1 acyl-CoA dehydrogenase [Kineobactrum sediminis]
MDFGFSDVQVQVQTLARKILDDKVSPATLARYDEYQQERFDRDLWRTLLGAGLPGVAIAERHGGMGLGFTELGLFIEELGRSLAPVPVLTHCVAAMLPLQQFAPAALQERVLPAAARGDVLLTGAFWWGQPGVPDDPVDATLEAGGLRLRGCCEGVPFALQADKVLLAARHADGTAIVLLDTAAEGVGMSPMQVTHFEPHYRVELQDVLVPAADIVCHEGGEALLDWTRERCIAALCAQQLGAADYAMRMAASYTSEREQFGVPIATFQAVGHRMADCYIDVECLRLCAYQAISMLNEGGDATTEVQIAKIWAGDVGHRVSYACQHVHGGTGIDRDYPLWRYCLWLRYNEMTLGNSSAHSADLGSRLAAGQALFN